jgi:hypothetical protein
MRHTPGHELSGEEGRQLKQLSLNRLRVTWLDPLPLLQMLHFPIFLEAAVMLLKNYLKFNNFDFKIIIFCYFFLKTF